MSEEREKALDELQAEAEKMAEEYVNKEVAHNDGSYWGWNGDDMALAKSAWLNGFAAAKAIYEPQIKEAHDWGYEDGEYKDYAREDGNEPLSRSESFAAFQKSEGKDK